MSREEGAVSDAPCERLNDWYGYDHHYCRVCQDNVECEGDKEEYLCEACAEELDKEETELWEGEASDKEATEEQNQVA